MTIHIPFFFVNRYELAVKWLRANLRRVSVCLLCRATWVRFPPGAETLFSIFTAILHGNEPVSEMTRVLSYCCAFYSRIPSVVISSCFGVLGVGPRAQTCKLSHIHSFGYDSAPKYVTGDVKIDFFLL